MCFFDSLGTLLICKSIHINIKIKEPPSPAPIEILTFDFYYYLSILFKKKDYRNSTSFGRSPRNF